MTRALHQPRLFRPGRAAPLPVPRPFPWAIAFLIFLFLCQLGLLASFLAPLRIFFRTASFSASLLLLFILPYRGRWHPAAFAALAVVAITALGIFHPNCNTLTASIAQVLLYASILAPLFWVLALPITSQTFSHLILALWIFHTTASFVGILQVYFPGKFQPNLSSVVQSAGRDYVGSLTFRLPDNTYVFRPMGLTDIPGGAGYSGAYTLMFGMALALAAAKPLHKSLALLSLPVGLAAICLSQVRVHLVLALVCSLLFIAMLFWRGRLAHAIFMSTTLAVVLLLSFTWAIALGGQAISKRLFSLVEEKPGSVYYQNRGHFLQDTFQEYLPQYPLGAGLGRWGMTNHYFGDNSNPQTEMIWSEIQWTSWILDGGAPLTLAYLAAIFLAFRSTWHIAMDRLTPQLATWAAMVLAYNVSALAATFNHPIFLSQSGLEFWLINAALFTAHRHAKNPPPTLITP